MHISFQILNIVTLQKENCICSQKFKIIKFIQPSTIIVSVFVFINILVTLTGKKLNQLKIMKNPVLKILSVLVSIYVLIYYFSLILYFYKLTDKYCACSKKKERNLLLYPILYIVLIIILSIILAGGMMANKKIKNIVLKEAKNK